MRCALIALSFLLMGSLSAQENPNYDPDFDDNGCYTVLDILSFLVILMPDDAGMDSPNPDYDPDFDNDGLLAMSDLLGLLTWFGGCEPELQCESPTMDGYTYDVVEIGDQCWFAENLRTTQYADGTPIPEASIQSEWESNAISTGGQAVYGTYGPCNGSYTEFDPCAGLETLEEFGRLYSLYAVQDPRGVCPVGWHVPSGLEWVELRDHVDDVDELMTVGAWPASSTNVTGFSAVPGGQNASSGFSGAGDFGFWWCSDNYSEGSSAQDTQTWFQLPIGFVGGLAIQPTALGNSVRCIQSAD